MRVLKRILIGSIIVYVVALLLDVFISKSFLKSNLFEGELNTWCDIYNKKINEDLIIYGSSRSYVHINPTILDKKLALNSYNLGFNGQKIELIKFRHKELLNNEIYPKNVLINLDINLLSNTNIFYPEQFIPLLLYKKEVYDLIKNQIDLTYLDVYIPLVRYRKFKYKEINMFHELYKVYFYSNYKHYSRKKGYRGMNYTWKDTKVNKEKILINKTHKKELEEIILDLKNHKSNIILINSPEYYLQIESQENRDYIINIYKSIALKNRIPFLDYSNDSLNFKKEYFYNTNHLNSKGADIFTRKLANDIKPYLK